MTIKDYLGQAYRIDQRINSKIEQVSSLRELATKATSTLSGVPRKTSASFHPMEDIMNKMIDLEAEINHDIDLLVDLKREMVDAIKAVSNPEYQTLLELRYLCFKSWEQIAVNMGYSTKHVFYVHSKALEEMSIPQSSFLLGQKRTL